MIRKFDLFLKNEALFLKLFIKQEIIISRKAITGAEGKINKPVLKIFISLIKLYLKFEFLQLSISNLFIRKIYQKIKICYKLILLWTNNGLIL